MSSKSDHPASLVAALFVLVWLGLRDSVRRVDENLWTED